MLRNFTLPFAERLLTFILLLGNERLPFRHSGDILYRQAADFLNDSGIFSGNRGQIKQRLQIIAEISRKRNVPATRTVSNSATRVKPRA